MVNVYPRTVRYIKMQTDLYEVYLVNKPASRFHCHFRKGANRSEKLRYSRGVSVSLSVRRPNFDPFLMPYILAIDMSKNVPFSTHGKWVEKPGIYRNSPPFQKKLDMFSLTTLPCVSSLVIKLSFTGLLSLSPFTFYFGYGSSTYSQNNIRAFPFEIIPRPGKKDFFSWGRS